LLLAFLSLSSLLLFLVLLLANGYQLLAKCS
jgi:hypothetical protein